MDVFVNTIGRECRLRETTVQFIHRSACPWDISADYHVEGMWKIIVLSIT